MVSFDFWSILLAFGILQGSFLIISILVKKLTRTNIFLVCLILVTNLNLSNYLLFSTGLYKKVPDLIYINHPLLFLIGPIYYFYIKSILIKKFKWRTIDLLHILPFVLAIFFHLNFYFKSSFEKTQAILWILENGRINGSFDMHLYIFIHTTITLIYIYYVSLLLNKWKERNATETKHKHWLNRFNLLFGMYWLVNFLILISLSVTIGLSVKTDYIVMLLTSLSINVLAFIALNYSKEYNQFQIDTQKNKKYYKSSLCDTELKEIVSRTQALMKIEKPYLNSNLKISNVAESLSISSNNLSQALNQILEQNFFDFVNEYRFKEMSSKLTDPKNEDYTIFGIALESGFSNKNTANKVFKHYSSMTPSEFIKTYKR